MVSGLGDRFYRKGDVRGEFKYSGQWCVVRWSYGDVVFGGVSSFARALFRSIPSLRVCYGGKVERPVGDETAEEYMAVLMFDRRATKRITPDLGYFAVAPDGESSRVRGVEEIELVLAQAHAGSERYREYRKRWSERVRADCVEYFGDRGAVMGVTEGMPVVARRDEIGESTQGSGVREDRGGSPRGTDGWMEDSEAMTIIDRTGRGSERGGRSERVRSIKRRIRINRRKLEIDELMEELYELGEECDWDETM